MRADDTSSRPEACQPLDAPDGDLLVRGLADGLTIHDAQGRYLYVSPSFARLTGFAPDDLLGRSPFESGVHPDDLSEVIEVQSEGLESGDPWRTVLRARRSDGAFVWVESAGRAVQTDAGLRFVVITREANQLESLAQGIEHERQLKQQLEELTARQRQFLTTVSHRARTPLTTVLGMAELLRHRGEELPAEQRRALTDRLHANAAKLGTLLEEATDADRLSRADVVLRRRVVDIADLVDAAVHEVVADTSSVAVDVEPDLHAVVDAAKVRRLLQILLGNAFKHAGVGASVQVSGRSTPDGIELVVDDDGPGIDPGLRDAVFDAFVQADSEAPDPGAGLGLYLVSELAALHRGRVRIEDAPSGGARFRVSLPRPRAGAAIDGSEPEDDQPLAAGLRPGAHRFVTQLLRTLHNRTGMELVYLTLLEGDHQHVLAAAGSAEVAGIEPGLRIPLEESYCARMVTDDLDHVVGDTRANPVTAPLPATGDGLACWVGVPVHLPSGQLLGTLCGASSTPRPDLPQSTADELHSFAAILGDQLAGDGFVDRSVLDATSRVTHALTTPGALTAVYQPIIDLDRGTVSCVEALSRFPGHDRPVDLWFADAARAGLSVDLETHAVNHALRALETLPGELCLTLNVSPSTVCSRRLTELLGVVPADRIVLEVTEHAAVEDYRPLMDALAPHRARGLRVAIDDVGTGHAGLGHLVQLRPDMIKVDRSLVETLAEDPAHAAAVGAIVRMAEHLQADLVAEGIERPETLAAVRETGFTHAQGFLLAEPEPAPDLHTTTTRVRQLLAAANRRTPAEGG